MKTDFSLGGSFGNLRGKTVVFASLLCLMLAMAGSGLAVEPANNNTIYVAILDGPISPATAGYIGSSIKKAADAGAHALIIEIDTPGGLGQSMRTIVKDIMNAPIPIIAYVTPAGAQAASAGVMVTMAADIAAMTPGTNIGAAHPVSSEGKDIPGDMGKKVVNDMVAMVQSIANERGRNAEWAEKAVRESVSASAKDALELNVIDFIAESRKELLEKINGRKIKRKDVETVLNTVGAKIVVVAESWRDKILKALANPNIVYILMMLGMAGLYFELSNPGAIFPGVIGGLSIILFLYASQILPINYTGVLLIALAGIFFILEIYVVSFGMLSIAGVVSLILGSLMMFDSPDDYFRVSLDVLISTVVLTSGFILVVSYLVVKNQLRQPISGTNGMIGLVGQVKEWDGVKGRIFVNGEWWNAEGAEGISSGQNVEVESVDGLNLKVKSVPGKAE